MKGKITLSKILTRMEAVKYQAEKIKVCCASGRNKKNRTKAQLCGRCKMRLKAVLNKSNI